MTERALLGATSPAEDGRPTSSLGWTSTPQHAEEEEGWIQQHTETTAERENVAHLMLSS